MTGWWALRAPDGQVQVLGTQRSGFGNETTGLGIARSTSEWHFLQLPALAPGTTVLLASDGVAEDLHPERLGDLIRHLVEDYGALQHARAALARALRQWPTRGHVDDKTLVVLWLAPERPSPHEE